MFYLLVNAIDFGHYTYSLSLYQKHSLHKKHL